MNWIAILGGLLLLGVAAFSVYYAFRSPKFIARLTRFASRQAWRVMKPVVTTPMTPDETKAHNQAQRQGRGDEFIRKKLGSLRPDR